MNYLAHLRDKSGFFVIAFVSRCSFSAYCIVLLLRISKKFQSSRTHKFIRKLITRSFLICFIASKGKNCSIVLIWNFFHHFMGGSTLFILLLLQLVRNLLSPHLHINFTHFGHGGNCSCGVTSNFNPHFMSGFTIFILLLL